MAACAGAFPAAGLRAQAPALAATEPGAGAAVHSVTILTQGLKFCEGPVFDRAGRLFVCEMPPHRLTRIYPDGRQEPWVVTGGTPNGAIRGIDGRIWVADSGRNEILAIGTTGAADGKIEVICKDCDGQPFKGPNDLVMDHAGNVYFTDPVGSDRAHPIGCVYRYDAATKKATRIADNIAFPNGIVLSDDEKTLYIGETQRQSVWAYALHADGTLGERKLASLLNEGKPWDGPDGIALDSKGRLLACEFGMRCVAVFDHGKLVDKIPIPDGQTTNLEFGGPHHDMLYITGGEKGAVYVTQWDCPGQMMAGDK
jgi:gluconolactonase